MPSRILNQSLVPEDAEILYNRYGTAPGLIIRTGETHDEFPNKNVIMLPGPPGELEPMFSRSVIPILKKERKQQIYSKCFYVCGIGESAVEDRMLYTIDRNPGVSVAYCASAQYVKLFIKSFSSEILGNVIRDIRAIFANELLPDRAESLAEEVLHLLRKNEDTLATAESCTGGLISKMITDIPGSSDVFQGSVVSYANRIKESILGVSPDTLQKFGAVSPETAKEMVLGLAEKFQVSAAVAATGIAGPDGGTPEKPVGLVYVGIFYQGRCEIFKLFLQRSREQIRERAACEALNRLRLMILGKI